jgi:hypothetical protein
MITTTCLIGVDDLAAVLAFDRGPMSRARPTTMKHAAKVRTDLRRSVCVPGRVIRAPHELPAATTKPAARITANYAPVPVMIHAPRPMRRSRLVRHGEALTTRRVEPTVTGGRKPTGL